MPSAGPRRLRCPRDSCPGRLRIHERSASRLAHPARSAGGGQGRQVSITVGQEEATLRAKKTWKIRWFIGGGRVRPAERAAPGRIYPRLVSAGFVTVRAIRGSKAGTAAEFASKPGGRASVSYGPPVTGRPRKIARAGTPRPRRSADTHGTGGQRH